MLSAIRSNGSWAKMPSERQMLWAKSFFPLQDQFRCITGVLSHAHTGFTLTPLTGMGLLLVYTNVIGELMPEAIPREPGFSETSAGSKTRTA